MMTPRSNPLRRWLLIGIATCAVLVLMTWPRLFVSEGRELTGDDVTLEEIVYFPIEEREGHAGGVFRIISANDDIIQLDPEKLKGYPMWSALAFEGYERVRWQTRRELENGPHQRLIFDVLSSVIEPVDESGIRTLEEARKLATWMSHQDDIFISGWFTKADSGITTNYFVYVLDLKRRLLVKLTYIC